MRYFYNVHIHADELKISNNIGFMNAVNIGDSITNGFGDPEYIVYDIVHNMSDNNTTIHVERNDKK